MGSAALDVYVRAFLARCGAMSRSDRDLFDEPGIHGLLPRGGDRRVRLLVTDDRAIDLLPTLIGDAGDGMITVCSAAVQCAALLADNPMWLAGSATAMVCRDLQKVPAVALPGELALRSVRRLAGDSPARRAARAGGRRREPGGSRDYRSTSACRSSAIVATRVRPVGRRRRRRRGARRRQARAAFEATGSVIFVNTDPGWRRRGIAWAMTATALRAAQPAGARSAGIDASDAGRGLYLRLGFEQATVITRFRLSR